MSLGSIRSVPVPSQEWTSRATYRLSARSQALLRRYAAELVASDSIAVWGRFDAADALLCDALLWMSQTAG
jgi:hypothetical protein